MAMLVTALLVSAFSVTAAGPASGLTAEVTGVSTMAPSSYESRVQHRVNTMRRDHGLPPLRLARCTDKVAEKWSGYLAANDLFYHQSMQEVLNRCDAMYAGETLGRGAITPRRLVRMWMQSPGHRVVLLSPKARRIGVGAELDSYGRWVTAANFMRF